MKTLSLIGAGQRGQFAYAKYVLSNPHRAKCVAVVEPDAYLRNMFVEAHQISSDMAFTDCESFFRAKVQCDAVMICTQDRQHFDMTMPALAAGYHVLLEKPMSPDPIECMRMGAYADKYDRVLAICHSLRYTNFFTKLKELLDGNAIGRLISITHNENVGYYHHAHSFTRGNWRRTDESAPMILAKSCHDLDILRWLAGSECVRLSSFGNLTHFTRADAPEGAAQRCIDGCKVEKDCPYSALKIYLHTGRREWPTNVITNGKETTTENIMAALQNGPYGRCVYHCDNDVVDDQIVNMAFENGVFANFNMCAYTHDISRTIKLMGSRGEIRGHMEKGSIEVYDFATGDMTTHHIAPSLTGHSGGDSGIMESFLEILETGGKNDGKMSHKLSIDSHLMVFAAEESRLTGRVVCMDEFKNRLMQVPYFS